MLGEIKADGYKCRKAEIDFEIDRLKRICATLTERIVKEQSVTDSGAKLCEVVSGEYGLSQSIVDSLIEKVYIYPDNHIEIVWKIADLFA